MGRLLLAEGEADGGAPGGRLMADALARALAVHVLRAHSDLSPPPPGARPTIAPSRLRRIVEYMRAQRDRDLSLAQLAGVGGLGASHFARAFRDATGVPPHRYLIGLRVERARELLERTELPVTAVALRCGFQQPSHFATTFRKWAGVSPRAWRVARRR